MSRIRVPPQNNGVLDVTHELARHLGIPHDAPSDVASLDNYINDELIKRLDIVSGFTSELHASNTPDQPV